MNQMTIKYNLYYEYGRTLEGVYATINIEYDKDSIKDDGLNENNLRVVNIVFEGVDLVYLKSHPFDIDRILKEVKKSYDFETLKEDFIENISDELYEEILEHHYG